jgi:hypothetical protein
VRPREGVFVIAASYLVQHLVAITGASEVGSVAGVERSTIQAIISLTLLGVASFVILSKRYGPKDKNWAYAAIGTLIGFWLTR